MPRIVLRLLLALCLVLNGTGSALAAAAMPAMPGGSAHAVMPMAASASAVTACDHGATEVGAMAVALQPPAQPTAPHPADCDQDCCTDGACQCPCLQLAQAALLTLPVLSVPVGQARMAAGFPRSHATPALPDLIRPPIG